MGGPGVLAAPAVTTVPAVSLQVPDDPRRLRELLELRQRHLRSRIAACEELTAAMAALRAALTPGPAASNAGPC